MAGSQHHGLDKGAPGNRAAPLRLKKRSEFLHVAKGQRQHMRLFSLQANARDDASGQAARFGLTVTKKAGCAVMRNRMRRRLRAALAVLPDPRGRDGSDYVIVARTELLHAPFDEVKAELAGALARVHERRAGRKSFQGQTGRPRAAAPQQTRDQAGS